MKKYFSHILDSGEDSSWEFFVVLGQFLPNLYYLDKVWTIENINKIFPVEKEEYWQYAMRGYLSFNNIVYEDIYNLLRNERHFYKAIHSEFEDKLITKRIVQYICIGLHQKWEHLDDEKSLMSILLKLEKAANLNEIVLFYRSFSKKKETVPEIMPLWESIFNICKKHIDENDEKDFKEVVADCWEWIKIVEDMDEKVIEYVKFSSKYFDVSYRGVKFIEYLSEFVENEPKKAGELFLAMADAGIIPSDESDDIRKIITLLFEKGEKDVATQICNIYMMNGMEEIVKDIYEKYIQQ